MADKLEERLRAFELMLIHADGLSIKPTSPSGVETTQITTTESRLLRESLSEAADEITRLNAENEVLWKALNEATKAIGICIDGFEKSNPTLGGLAAIHMLKDAQARYDALITKAQPPGVP